MMGSSHSSEADLRAETHPFLDDEIEPAPPSALREVVVDSMAVEIAAASASDALADAARPDYGSTRGETKKAKKEKSPQKAVADQLKTDMAAERTFFKWLWTGLHTGAIGSFIFVTFDSDESDPMRLVVVAFAWIVAFLLVLYGLFAYYRRRQALRTGQIDRIPAFTREHSPIIVVVALGLVVGSALLYAAFSGTHPKKGKMAGAIGARVFTDATRVQA